MTGRAAPSNASNFSWLLSAFVVATVAMACKPADFGGDAASGESRQGEASGKRTEEPETLLESTAENHAEDSAAGERGPNATVDINAADRTCIEPPDLKRDCPAIARKIFEKGIVDKATGRLLRAQMDDLGYQCMPPSGIEAVCKKRGGSSLGEVGIRRFAEYNPIEAYCIVAIYDYRVGGKRLFATGDDAGDLGTPQQGDEDLLPFCHPPVMEEQDETRFQECIPGQTAVKFTALCSY